MTPAVSSPSEPFHMPQSLHLLLHPFVTDMNTVGRKVTRPVKRFNHKRKASSLAAETFATYLMDMNFLGIKSRVRLCKNVLRFTRAFH
jgi:hypothetical protein